MGVLDLIFHLECLRLGSCPLWFSFCLFPIGILFNLLCCSWYHHQWRNPTFCTCIHCHRASWVEFFTIYSIASLTNNTAVSILMPFVLDQYIIPTFLGNLKFPSNVWDARFFVDLSISHQCCQCPISVKSPVSRLCNRGGSGLLLDLLCLKHSPHAAAHYLC